MWLKHSTVKVFVRLKQSVTGCGKKIILLESLPDKASVIFQKK